jgi:hypothetical protein
MCLMTLLKNMCDHAFVDNSVCFFTTVYLLMGHFLVAVASLFPTTIYTTTITIILV